MGPKPRPNVMTPRLQVSIILMGGTGTGKTSFTNLAGGSQFTIGEGLESCTQSVQYHRFSFKSKDITLIDVPGFDDTNKSDIDILKVIVDFLVKEHQEHRPLHGILFFHRISDVRMGGAARRNLTMFQKLCGTEAFKNVAIVTTRWDEEEKEVAEARLVELKKKPFKEVLDGHGEIFCHDRSPRSAQKILDHFLRKDAVSLLIQREIVQEHKELSETAAGEELHREIREQMEKHRKEMGELMEEMEKTNADSMQLKDLENECLELQERIAHCDAESEKLAHSNIGKVPKTAFQSAGSMLQSGSQSSTQPQASRRTEHSLDNGQSSLLTDLSRSQTRALVNSNRRELPTTRHQAASSVLQVDPSGQSSARSQVGQRTEREKDLEDELARVHAEMDGWKNSNSELKRKLDEMQRNQQMWEKDKASLMRGLRNETKTRMDLEKQQKHDEKSIRDLKHQLENADSGCTIV